MTVLSKVKLKTKNSDRLSGLIQGQPYRRPKENPYHPQPEPTKPRGRIFLKDSQGHGISTT